ncbi:hypothetical protein CRYUN_Cryun41cG0051000 [Craigia yunnanensis]
MILGDLLGRGIFNVDGEMWMFQRKMASLELANISIRAYAFEIVATEIKCRLLSFLSSFTRKDGSILDLQEVFRRFSFDNICKFSFGLDPGCLESSLPVSQFADAFDLASKLSAERAMAPLPLLWKIKRLFNIGSEKVLREAIEVVNVLAMELITLKSSQKPKTRQINSWNQIKHSMIFLPDSTFIPKGTRVTYHPYAMGRMENIWGQDFIKFKPERWLKNGTFCPQCPFKYPVFQAGVRVCLGKELALVAMKMVVLSVLHRFDIELVAPKAAPQFDPGLTAMVRGGLQVVVRERRDIAAA